MSRSPFLCLITMTLFFSCDDQQETMNLVDAQVMDQFVIVVPDQSIKDMQRTDQAMLPPDMAMLPPDMAMLPPDMAMLPPDMAMLPPDMAMLPPDMAMLPPDMAMLPPDMAMLPPDMAMLPPDMAMLPPDMAMLPPDMLVDMQVLTQSNHLVINEVDYDQASIDFEEFIEIYNPTAEAIDLRNYRIDLINGSQIGNADEVYGRFIFREAVMAGTANAMLEPGQYFVIGSSRITTLLQGISYMTFSNDENQLQNAGNSGDGMRLIDLRNDQVIDAMAYGPRVAGLNEGNGRIDSTDSTGTNESRSVMRCPNGQDSDNNQVDFIISTPPTPGVNNSCMP